MMVTEEWIYWSGDGGSGGLSSLAGRGSVAQTQGGSHPKILRSSGPRPFTKVFYCYYQPKPRQFKGVFWKLPFHNFLCPLYTYVKFRFIFYVNNASVMTLSLLPLTYFSLIHLHFYQSLLSTSTPTYKDSPPQPPPPTQPAPSQTPTPTQPAPSQPLPPTQPAPSQPLPPTQPAPSQPLPPTQPATSQPLPPTQPATSQPLPPTQPAPIQPLPPTQPAPLQPLPLTQPVGRCRS